MILYCNHIVLCDSITHACDVCTLTGKRIINLKSLYKSSIGPRYYDVYYTMMFLIIHLKINIYTNGLDRVHLDGGIE